MAESHGSRGKWSAPGVPHRGWQCVNIEDLGAPDLICEMCELQEIRYVHYMQHSAYPETLKCGCVCAGHMEENLAGAKRRETLLQNSAKRRAAWPDRKGWKKSRKGNPYIKVDGYHITIFPSGASWGGVVKNSLLDFELFAKRQYPTIRAAQLAAFDAMILHKSRT